MTKSAFGFIAPSPVPPSTPPPPPPSSENVRHSPTLAPNTTDLYAVVDLTRKKKRTRQTSEAESPEGAKLSFSSSPSPDETESRAEQLRGQVDHELAPDCNIESGYECISDPFTTVVHVPEASRAERTAVVDGEQPVAVEHRFHANKTGSLTRHVSGALYCSSASITFIDDIDDDEEEENGDEGADGDDPNYSTLEETIAEGLTVTHSRQSSLNYEESWQKLEQNPGNPHGLVHISQHTPNPNLWQRPEHIYQELDPAQVKRRKNSRQKRSPNKERIRQRITEDRSGEERKPGDGAEGDDTVVEISTRF